jgi:hypothetical protein
VNRNIQIIALAVATAAGSAATAATADGQLLYPRVGQSLGSQVMVGHPMPPRPQNPPTLPRGNKFPTPQLTPRHQPKVVYVAPALCCYYDYYGAQRQPDVSVNVTNVIQQPPTVVQYVPTFTATEAMAVYTTPVRIWSAEEEMAQIRAREAAAAEARVAPLSDADRADVSSLEAIIAAYYDVLSGPRGTPRNWERFRALFAPEGRITRTGQDSSDRRPDIMTPDDFRSIVAPDLERGAFAREVSRKVERFGAMAQVFSTYEVRRMATDATPHARGINSMQVSFDGKRWWIVSVAWGEDSTTPIPARRAPAR